MNRNWTPVKRGGAYCSPACGGGEATCSIKRYEHAKAAGATCARDLGEGWTPRMSENLGWHVSVGSPCRRIWVSLYDAQLGKVTGYTAFLGPPNEHGGSGKWAAHGKTARQAIEKVLEQAMHDLGLVQGVVSGLTVPPKRRLKARR